MTMYPAPLNNRSAAASSRRFAALPTTLAAALALTLMLGASAALAKGPDGGYTQGGGFTGPGPALATVKQAKDMRDDTPVTLRGHIIRQLGDELYEFKDDTGTINVEIDHKRWRGQNVGPNDLVEISGEVEKDWSELEIDVKRIIKK